MNCKRIISFAIVAGLVLAGSAAADDFTWVGAEGAPWPIEANWTPTEGRPGTDDTALINMPGQVVLVVGTPSNPVPTVGNLTVTTGTKLDLGRLNINASDQGGGCCGLINNEGTIRIQSGILTIRSGQALLRGVGDLMMAKPIDPDKKGADVNKIMRQFGGTLVIKQTIHGTGLINVDLNNSLGTIDADIGGQELVLLRMDIDNNGNDGGLRASGGGTLRIQGSGGTGGEATVTNQGGSLLAFGDDSVVELSIASKVVGGSLIAQNSGIIRGNGGTVKDVTITGPMEIDHGNLTLTGLVTNNGTTTFVDTNGSSIFIGATLDGNNKMNLTGSGVISLSNPGDHIRANDHNMTFVHGSGHTIEGFGRVDTLNNTFAIDNRGTIDANVKDKTLIVNPGTKVISTNTGALQASNGGILLLRGPSSISSKECGDDQLCHWDNAGGTIEATGAGSIVELDNTRIRGNGTLRGGEGGVVANFDSPSVIFDAADDSMFLSGTIIAGTAQTILTGKAGSEFRNIGNFVVDSEGEFDPKSGIARLLLQSGSEITLTQSGNVRLNGTKSQFVAFSGSDPPTIHNDKDHTVQGAGTFGDGEIFIDNQGSIIANIKDKVLLVEEFNSIVDPTTVPPINALDPFTTFNNGGKLIAQDGGILDLRPNLLENNNGLIIAKRQGEVNLGIFGGTVTQFNGGKIQAEDGGVVVLQGGVKIKGGLLEAGSIFGSIQVKSEAFISSLSIKGTLNVLSGSTAFVDDIILGDGADRSGIVLDAEQSSTQLFVEKPGGSAKLNGIKVEMRSGTGIRKVAAVSGTIGEGGFADSELTVGDGASIVGAGIVGQSRNAFMLQGTLNHLDVSPGGSVVADASITGTNTLVVNPIRLTNKGTLSAEAESILHLKETNGSSVDNHNEILAVAKGAVVQIESDVLQAEDAVIGTSGGGLVVLKDTRITSGKLSGQFLIDVNLFPANVTLDSVEILRNSLISVPPSFFQQLKLSGNIDNDGVIEIGDGGALLGDDVTVRGIGRILMTGKNSLLKLARAGGEKSFLNDLDHTIEGVGTIDFDQRSNFDNLGTIIANGHLKENGERTPGDLVIDNSFTNKGTLKVEGAGNKLIIAGDDDGGGLFHIGSDAKVVVGLGAELQIPGNAYEAGRGTTTENNGTIEARHIGIRGKVTGTGVYKSLTRLLPGGVISPADSPGTLTIDGDYEQQGGLLEIELGGTTADSQYDVLAVTGLASFFEGSELQVQLIDAFGGDDVFEPAPGDMFDVVLADIILDQGLVFDFPVLPGLEFEHEIVNTGSAQALRLRVVVPEPATLPLLIVGALLACHGRQRRR